jgi:CubicO group peptidase (beta-lactamase class C family)
MKPLPLVALCASLALVAGPAALGAATAAAVLPTSATVDAEVARAMAATGAQGMALAIIDDGQVVHVGAYGHRNAAGDPLQTNTIMYGASLTKAAFAYMVMQLFEEGVLDLDTTIDHYLERPLPEYSAPEVEDLYARWSDLAGDERWRELTPRRLLTHSSGFANFGFLEPDGILRFHFAPGSRYGYSGDGFILLQFVLERGLGLDVGREMQRRVFEPLAMPDSSLIWRDDYAGRLADGWGLGGDVEPHDSRSAVRAAGSMDTTITDMAHFAAGYVRGDRLSPTARTELTRAQLPITTAGQFPSLQPELAPAMRRPDLAAGLGVVAFTGPQGPGFMKGGHNDWTGNVWVCVESLRRCVLILANDVRAEAAFPQLVDFVLGETGAPWTWEYGDLTFWRPAAPPARTR